MSFINWNENIALDISEIDNQHKRLVEIISTLFDAMKDARGLEIIDDILNRLTDYVDYHFSTEEKYFNQFEYVEFEHHKDEHKHFFEQISTIKAAYDEGKIKRDGRNSPITVEVWNLLKEWPIYHIQVSDKKYVTLFKEKGLI